MTFLTTNRILFDNFSLHLAYSAWTLKYYPRHNYVPEIVFTVSLQVFLANKDRNTIAYNMLNPPITTRFIRIKPMEWRGHISMRMEIYGCPGIKTYIARLLTQ